MDNILNKLNDIKEKIDILNYLITKFDQKIKRMKNEAVNELCENFIYDYHKLTGIKRFSIPVFGKISSGKSTLLNYILHFHVFLKQAIIFLQNLLYN